MLLILATARRAIEADQFTRSGQFTGWRPDLLLGQDVSGATLGLGGFGRIARATALRAAAFGMSITFCSHPPAGHLVDEAELAALPYPVRQVSWTELVEGSDFLSVHVPLAPTTRHLIDTAILAAMKPTAILINTARGPIVDESALVDALRSGRLAGAGLDVYEDEPRLYTRPCRSPRTPSSCHTWGKRDHPGASPHGRVVRRECDCHRAPTHPPASCQSRGVAVK